jgi:NADH-quinone oxidoreductase subunit E
MSVRRLAPKEQQPESFAFSAENLAWAKKQIEQYPPGRQASASIAILWRAQEQHDGWVSEAAIRVVADMLDMPYIRMLEIATFYTMFQLQPVGKKAHIQVCGTTPCRLRGAEDILAVCKSRIHHESFHLSKDGDFSWEEVECLGACVNAPMALIWKDTYEDLTKENFGKVLDGFASGNPPKPGPQIDRQFSAPVGGPTTLNTAAAKGVPKRSAGDATKKGKT